MLRPLVVLLWLAVLFTLGVHTAASRSGPYFADGKHFFVKPTGQIDISGTGSWLIDGSRWNTWSAAAATARTTLFANTCTPDCAAANYRSRPARVRFFHVFSCHGKAVFRDFVITDLGGRRLFSGNFRALGYLRAC